jgi:hypothetical protein
VQTFPTKHSSHFRYRIGLYASIIKGCSTSQFATGSLQTSPDSPLISLNTIRCCFLELSNHQYEVLKPLYSVLATSFPCSFIICPFIQKFLCHTLINHSHTSSTISKFQIFFSSLNCCYKFVIDFLFITWFLICPTIEFSQH